MSLRVDLEKLRELTGAVKELEVEARVMRDEYERILSRIKQLHNTIDGLSQHFGFGVELTPVEILKKDDLTLSGRPPCITEREVDLMMDREFLGDEKTPEIEMVVLQKMRRMKKDA